MLRRIAQQQHTHISGHQRCRITMQDEEYKGQ